ncbi:hypothetical protein ACFUIY_41670 [Streptomyces griseorubiginosus]|uniref:hypothetical protein n=1 Tax=Streptomyces griseorubiginosus TaxID=67304 RepID=UPI00114043DB|nr:hypothetical protein [Streptomyces griseorubiginosus]
MAKVGTVVRAWCDDCGATKKQVVINTRTMVTRVNGNTIAELIAMAVDATNVNKLLGITYVQCKKGHVNDC